MVANCTAFKNIYDKIPYYLPVDKALERIKNGNSRQMVFEIRNTIDKERQDKLNGIWVPKLKSDIFWFLLKCSIILRRTFLLICCIVMVVC